MPTRPGESAWQVARERQQWATRANVRVGVWGHCDNCDEDGWVDVWEYDYLDEPVTWICMNGCDEQ